VLSNGLHHLLQIVASPARLKAELEAASQALADARAAVADAEDEKRAAARRVDVLRKAAKDLGKVR
jgi:hypothetical protein